MVEGKARVHTAVPTPKACSAAIARRRHRKRVARIVAEHWVQFAHTQRACRFFRRVTLHRFFHALNTTISSRKAHKHNCLQRLSHLHNEKVQAHVFASMKLLKRTLSSLNKEQPRTSQLVHSAMLSSWRSACRVIRNCKTASVRMSGLHDTHNARSALLLWQHAVKNFHQQQRVVDSFALKLIATRAQRFLQPARIQTNRLACSKAIHQRFNKHHMAAVMVHWRNKYTALYSARIQHTSALNGLQQVRAQSICRGACNPDLQSVQRKWRELYWVLQQISHLKGKAGVNVRSAKKLRVLSTLQLELLARHFCRQRAMQAAMEAFRKGVACAHEENRRLHELAQSLKAHKAVIIGNRWKKQAHASKQKRIADRHLRHRLTAKAIEQWEDVSANEHMQRRLLREWAAAVHCARKATRFVLKLGLMAMRWYSRRRAAEEAMRRHALRWYTYKLFKRFFSSWEALVKQKARDVLDAWKGPFLQAARARRQQFDHARKHRQQRLLCLVLSGWIEVVEADRGEARKEASIRASSHFRGQARVISALRKAFDHRCAQRRRLQARASRAHQCIGELLLGRALHEWKRVADEQLVQSAMSAHARLHFQSKMEVHALLVWRARASEWAHKRHLNRCAALHYMQSLHARALAGLSAHTFAVKRQTERAHMADVHYRRQRQIDALSTWKHSAAIQKSERQAVDDAVEEYWSRVRREAISKVLTACFERRRNAMSVVAMQEADHYRAALERVAPLARRWKRKALNKAGRPDAILKYLREKPAHSQRQQHLQYERLRHTQTSTSSRDETTGMQRYRGYSNNTTKLNAPMQMLADVMEPLQKAKNQLGSVAQNAYDGSVSPAIVAS